MPNHKIIQYLCQSHCNEEDIRRYSYLKESYYRKFCKEDISTFHLVDEVKEYFEMLKEKDDAKKNQPQISRWLFMKKF